MIKTAKDFYTALNDDTNDSKLTILRIFEEPNTRRVALYFKYKWTLKNNKEVAFNVVDIIEFDQRLKIKSLEIIYDTVESRNQVGLLRN